MLKRIAAVNKGEDEREGYIDTDGEVGTPHYDTIEKRDFLERIAFADQEPIAWESEHPGVLQRRCKVQTHFLFP